MSKELKNQVKELIKGNKFLVLKQLLSDFNGECDKSWINLAAKYNLVNIVGYLREKGCTWDETFPACAASNDNGLFNLCS